MRTYNFALVVDGVDDSDEAHVEALVANDDVVMVSSVDGVVSVDLAIDAVDSGSAIRTGVAIVERAIAGSRVLRVDDDLVAATDIVERVGVSRQAVTQWATGPKHFPAPVGHVAGGTRIWPWSSVVPWLHEHGHLVDEFTLTRASIVEANALLGRDRQPGRLATVGEWHRPDLRTGSRTSTIGVRPVRAISPGQPQRLVMGDGDAVMAA